MIQIALVGIVTVMFAAHFKQAKSEFGVYLGIMASFLIMYFGLSKLDVILETMKKIQGYIAINQGYLGILIKIIGITYIAEFSSSICKDAGHAAIGTQIELVGKLTILAISMPILLALLDTVNQFLVA